MRSNLSAEQVAGTSSLCVRRERESEGYNEISHSLEVRNSAATLKFDVTDPLSARGLDIAHSAVAGHP